MEATKLRVKRLSKTAQIPKAGSEGAAGLDLYADIGAPRQHNCEDHQVACGNVVSPSYLCNICIKERNNTMIIPPQSKALVPLNIALEIPWGFYGRIAPRSSMAMKHVAVGAGVVDSDYRGPVGVVLFNLSPGNNLEIKTGDRIAQLILEKISLPHVWEVDELEDTRRGAGGFGSTGK